MTRPIMIAPKRLGHSNKNNSTANVPQTSARRKRQEMGWDGDSGRSISANGGLVGAMFHRQATGGRGRRGRGAAAAGAGSGLGARELLSARGEFRKRVRGQLEGMPEAIVDVKKALASGDHSALFAAVLAIRTKLVEGSSAPFDLPVTSQQHSRHGGGPSSAGGAGGGDGHYHGHRHGDDDDDDAYHQNGSRQTRRLDRDAFVALGGPDLLVEVLKRPGSPSDARLISPSIVARDTPVWNTTLIILRELCFTDQDLSERLGSSELILFLLTMMAHPAVFDLAVGLVEEILAVKSSTHFLGEVPDLHSLLENMTSQQLAHLSRVLALLVFEPEYRQLMESAHVLRSMELLQLRRDRVVRADSVIDKNQALILSAPNLLPRLMELLRVMNFNPPLAVFDEHAMEMQDVHVAQVRVSLVGGEGGGFGRSGSQQQPVASEWGYLAGLRVAAETTPSPEASIPTSESSVSARGAPSLPSQPHDTERRRVGEPSRIANFFRFLFRRRAAAAAADSASSASSESSAAAAAADLAAAAAPPSIAAANARSAGGEEGARAAALAAGAAAVQLQAAHFHATGNGAGGASPYAAERGPRLPSGEPVDGVEGMAGFAIRDFLNLLQPAFVGPDPAGSIASLEQALTWPMGSAMMPGLGGGAGMVSRRRLQNPSASEAREELQFHGLLLAPHQVEVLFVLCTLLGARRKGEAHETLANLGLIDVLDAMFDRLSWGVPSRQEGPHGAHCDCNPESALRVQYLRLVHNFLDRDSNNNPLKRLLLSPDERSLFTCGSFMPNPNGSGNVVFVKHGVADAKAQPPFVWRGRASSGVPGESEEEQAKWKDTRGLLSKIVDVFMKEPMDSLYRFWLASCVEAFLRGGSTQEQLFIAGGGLLPHLVKEITSDGIWCAGSLQTAFDLLGELCKGNCEVLEMLEASMTQTQMRRFLEVMVDNLVDSNVFMRSLVLSVEHGAFRQEFRGGDAALPSAQADTSVIDGGGRNCEGGVDGVSDAGVVAVKGELIGQERNAKGSHHGDGDPARDGVESVVCGDGGEEEEEEEEDEEGEEVQEPYYLGHTWYDVQAREVENWVEEGEGEGSRFAAGELVNAVKGLATALPSSQVGESPAVAAAAPACAIIVGGEKGCDASSGGGEGIDENLAESLDVPGRTRGATVSLVGAQGTARRGRRMSAAARAVDARGLTQLQCFLTRNTPQLVRDLMCVVNLETINHENICCLNTAILILIFADQRGRLAELLQDVRSLPAGRGTSGKTGKLSEFDVGDDGEDDRQDRSGYGMNSGGAAEDHGGSTRSRPNLTPGRNAKGGGVGSDDAMDHGGDDSPQQDGPTVLRGFRRLLWFWSEYYLRGGRDSLSLEFSTHVKFWAWKRVVRLLCADDGAPTALVAAPLRLPRSPYNALAPVFSRHDP